MKKRLRSVACLFLVFFFAVSGSQGIFAANQNSADILFEKGFIESKDAMLDENISRGEFASVLNGTLGFFTTTYTSFTDNPKDSAYYYDIMAANYVGYLSGYGDNTVRPNEPVTRVAAAIMLDKALTLPEVMDGPTFADNDKIPLWGMDAARRVIGRGIMDAKNGGAYFNPDDKVTRGEAYDMMAAIIELGIDRTFDYEYKNIKSFDGYALETRISVPRNLKKIDKVVITINGSGPNTYEVKTEQGDLHFKYYDFFAEEFAKDSVALLSHNTRGVHIAEAAPFYTVNDKEYLTYIPNNQVKDIEIMIKEIKKDPRFKDAKIYLMGWSEGAAVAPYAVLKANLRVDGLLLCGYPNENMREVLVWQNEGEQMMFIFKTLLGIETDEITKEQYENADKSSLDALYGVSMTYDELDVNKDGKIDVTDTKEIQRPQYEAMLNAIETDDNEWFKNNYLTLTSAWFKDHFSIGKTEDNVVAIKDIPIYVLHGDLDFNCSPQSAVDLKARVEKEGNKNIEVDIFKGHDHSLNYAHSIYLKQLSEGYQRLFEIVRDAK